MSTLKDRLRIAGALVLILLGAFIVVFYQREEFGFLIGIASIGVGLGFLWRLQNKKIR